MNNSCATDSEINIIKNDYYVKFGLHRHVPNLGQFPLQFYLDSAVQRTEHPRYSLGRLNNITCP